MGKPHDDSVLRRLGRTFAGVGVLLLLLSLLSTAALLRSRSISDEITHRDVAMQRHVDQALATFYRLQIAKYGYLSTAEPEALRVFDSVDDTLRRYLQTLASGSTLPAERAAAARLSDLLRLHHQRFDRRRAILSGQAQPESTGEYQGLAAEEARLLGQGEALLRQLTEERTRATQRKLDQLDARVLQTLGLVLLTLLGGLSGLALTYYAGRCVARRLQDLSAAIRGMAQGGHGGERLLPVVGTDEIAHVARAFNELQEVVAERSEQLRRSVAAAEASSRERGVLLGNISDGLVTLDAEGRLGAERSRQLEAWLGRPEPGATFWEYLQRSDVQAAAAFEVGWMQLAQGFLPAELLIDQMPRRAQVGEQVLRIDYKPLGEAGGMMLVLKDISSEVARERLEAEQRELWAALDKLMHNRAVFRDFFGEATELVQRLATVPELPVPDTRRLVHTLKGNASMFGLSSIATFCHDIETRMNVAADAWPADRDELSRRWRSLADKFEKIIGQEDRLEVEDVEYRALVQGLRAGTSHGLLLQQVLRWRLQPTQARLEQLADQLHDVARRLNKEPLKVLIEANDLRLPADRWAGFWSAFTHAVRNAVDHGLEGPEERRALGKPEEALVQLRTYLLREQFVVEISDDGRGLDWERLRRRAEERGLPARTPADLEAALFADGVSTKEEVSEYSGRGVGLAAVRAACQELGGWVLVHSQRGAGTCMQFCFPRSTMMRVNPTPGLSMPPHA